MKKGASTFNESILVIFQELYEKDKSEAVLPIADLR